MCEVVAQAERAHVRKTPDRIASVSRRSCAELRERRSARSNPMMSRAKAKVLVSGSVAVVPRRISHPAVVYRRAICSGIWLEKTTSEGRLLSSAIRPALSTSPPARLASWLL